MPTIPHIASRPAELARVRARGRAPSGAPTTRSSAAVASTSRARLAAPARRARRGGSASASRRHAASASTSATGNSQPLRPGTTKSSLPLTRRGHHRQPAGHELEQRVRQPLDARGQEARRRPRRASSSTRSRWPRNSTCARDAQPLGLRAQLASRARRRRRAAAARRSRPANARAQASSSVAEPLLRHQPPDEHARVNGAASRARRRARREARGVDGVRQHHDPLGGKSVPRQLAGDARADRLHRRRALEPAARHAGRAARAPGASRPCSSSHQPEIFTTTGLPRSAPDEAGDRAQVVPDVHVPRVVAVAVPCHRKAAKRRHMTPPPTERHARIAQAPHRDAVAALGRRLRPARRGAAS